MPGYDEELRAMRDFLHQAQTNRLSVPAPSPSPWGDWFRRLWLGRQRDFDYLPGPRDRPAGIGMPAFRNPDQPEPYWGPFVLDPHTEASLLGKLNVRPSVQIGTRESDMVEDRRFQPIPYGYDDDLAVFQQKPKEPIQETLNRMRYLRPIKD